MARLVGLLAAAVLALSAFGCRAKVEETIVLPPTPALSAGSSWGVVTSSYLRLRVAPARDAKVVEGLTRGTVVEILGVTERKETVETQTDFWYRVNLDGIKGWAFGAYLQVVDSRSKAEVMAERLR